MRYVVSDNDGSAPAGCLSLLVKLPHTVSFKPHDWTISNYHGARLGELLNLQPLDVVGPGQSLDFDLGTVKLPRLAFGQQSSLPDKVSCLHGEVSYHTIHTTQAVGPLALDWRISQDNENEKDSDSGR